MPQAPDNLLTPPDRLLSLPVLLLPSQNVEITEQSGLVIFVGIAATMILVTLMIAWHFSEAAGFAVTSIVALIAGLGIVLYVKNAKDAERSLIIAHDSLWLGKEEIGWDRISSLAVEEIEQETGPSEYRVTFCVPGENTFGKWHSLNPKIYVHSLSPKSRANALFRCLSEAQRRFFAKEFEAPDAVTPVSPHFQTSIDDIDLMLLRDVREPYQG